MTTRNTHILSPSKIRSPGAFNLLRRKVKKHGVGYAKRFARMWVEEDQPMFLSSRELSNILSYAIEGKRELMHPVSYIFTKYGPAIYRHMWSM
jgi:hypothetical protein